MTSLERTHINPNYIISKDKPLALAREIYVAGQDRKERELKTENVIHFMNNVNALSAAHVWKKIQDAYESGDSMESQISQFKVDLDTKSKIEMEQALHDAPFIVKIKGCEGGKEQTKYGDEAEVPLLSGHYGLSHVVPFENRHILENVEDHDVVEVVIDPIEGTEFAANNEPGAFSAGAGIKNGEIARIPTDNEAMYMDRIIGPARLRRLGNSGLSIDATAEHNMKQVMRAFRLSRPNQIEVVVLDRLRNRELIEDLQKFGVNLRFINRGDLAPALASLTADRPILSMGKGGKEEAVIGAITAFATGGFFEGRYTDLSGNPVPTKPDALKLRDLVNGNKSDAFASFSSITGMESRDSRTGVKIDLGALEMPAVYKVGRGRNSAQGYNVSGGFINGADGFFRKNIIPLN